MAGQMQLGKMQLALHWQPSGSNHQSSWWLISADGWNMQLGKCSWPGYCQSSCQPESRWLRLPPSSGQIALLGPNRSRTSLLQLRVAL